MQPLYFFDYYLTLIQQLKKAPCNFVFKLEYSNSKLHTVPYIISHIPYVTFWLIRKPPFNLFIFYVSDTPNKIHREVKRRVRLENKVPSHAVPFNTSSEDGITIK